VAVSLRSSTDAPRSGRRRRVRQNGRRDANHDEIVGLFEALGCSVLDVSGVSGALDLIVGAVGIDQRVEVKDGSKPPSERRLTEAELLEIAGWRGRRPVGVETAEDVLALVARMRDEARRKPPGL